MIVKRAFALVAGTVAAILGSAAVLFVGKGVGDLLLPETPGFSVNRAVASTLIALGIASVLFFEAFRLFNSALGLRNRR